MSNKLQTYEGGHSYSGYRSSKTQCGTGGSREPPVPVEGVQAIRAIERYGKRYSGYRTLFKRYVGPMESMGNPEDPWGPGSLSDPWDPFGPWGP